MRVLITFGSKLGGTAGIATRLAEGFRECGLTVEVSPAHQVRNVRGYDAVLIGGALYASRWHRDARRFVLRNASALRERRVWFFSSGPLDDSARKGEIPPTPSVRQLMDFIGAEGHATFGGRLERDAKGFLVSAMAKKMSGDWRDPDSIRAWATSVTAQLRTTPSPRSERGFVPLPSRAVPVALGILTGVSALFGGVSLVARPDGSLIQLPLSVLSHAPFHNFLIPGLLLMLVVGLGNVWAAALQIVRSDFAPLASFFGGAALLGWTAVEMIMLRSANALQIGCLVVAAGILATAVRQLRAMLPSEAQGRSTPLHA